MSDLNQTQQAFPNADALATMLKPVKLAFLQSLEAHIPAFEEVSSIPPELWSNETIQDIAHRAHKIAGVAATLGYTQLGHLAARLEADLRQRQHDGELSETVKRKTSEMKSVLRGSTAKAAE